MSDPNPFQVLRWDIVKTIFAEEVEYLKAKRWDFAQHKPDFFVALNVEAFSLHHLDQIHRMMDAEKAAIHKRLEDEQRKATSGANLTSLHAHRNY